VFYNGFFLDYYGIPSVNTYLPPFTMVVDVVNNVAAIPGFGNTPMVFTHTFDIASFVAASLDLEKWERESYVVGDRVTWNGFVELAEAATGKTSGYRWICECPSLILTCLLFKGPNLKSLMTASRALKRGKLQYSPRTHRLSNSSQRKVSWPSLRHLGSYLRMGHGI
jgi:hypothetical protein